MKKCFLFRCLVLMLAFLMLAAAMASCGGRGTPAETTGAQSDDGATSAPEETEPATDANGYLLDSVPTLDYGNEKFKIMGWKDRATDFTANEDTVDTVEYATYARNKHVEDRLNISLVFDVSQAGGDTAQTSYIQHVTQVGDSFDLLGCYSRISAEFAIAGLTCDLSPYTQIDMSKPWWYQNAVENARINDKIYFVAGAVANSIAQESMVIAVNLELVDSYDLEDPRLMVLDDRWTLETFFGMINDVGIDMNDNGKDDNDFYGYVNGYTVFMDGFYSGSGLSFLSTDDTGRVIVSSDFAGSKASDLASFLEPKLKSDDCYAPATGDKTSIFYGKRSIFCTTGFDVMLNNKENMDFEYSYLPYPKWQTSELTQENFYTTIGFPSTLFSIAEACSDKNRAAYVLECLSSEGYRTVRVKYYNKLRYQLGNGALDLQMFDLIVENSTFDKGRLFMSYLGWAAAPVAIFRETMIGYDTKGFVTRRDEQEPVLQRKIDEINAKFFETNEADS